MSETAVNPGAKREWRRGWPLVASSTIGVTMSPLLIYTSGLFIAPLEEEFGWSRAQVTSGLTVKSIVAVVLVPFVGRLLDRIGCRKIAIPGVLLFCAAFAAFATANGSLSYWLFLWLLAALAALFIQPTVWVAAVASRFDRSRGLAIAVTLCGTGIAAILGPSLGGYFLENYGWRTSYLALAGIWLVVGLPLILLFFFSASDQERSRPQPEADAKSARQPAKGLPIELLRSVKFVKLVSSVVLVVVVIAAAQVHFIPFMTDAGLTAATAGGIAAFIGVGSITGRLVTGWFLDRLNASFVGGAAFVFIGMVMLGMIGFDGTIAFGFLLAFLLGFGAGAEYDIAAYLMTRHFGLANFGLLFSVMVGLMTFATGTAPYIAGLVYDNWGSYEPAMWAAIPICVFAGLLIATLGPYDTGQTKAVAQPAE